MKHDNSVLSGLAGIIALALVLGKLKPERFLCVQLSSGRPREL
jgi:hypothetical protein